MESVANYNMGEVVTAVEKGVVDATKPDKIIYVTIDGRVGMFYPFEGEEEDELMRLRQL